MANDDWKKFSNDPLASTPPDCAACAAGRFEARQREDAFFMECPSCGRRGPEGASLYEAQAGWLRMMGRPSLGAPEMTRVIAITLLLVGVGLMILNLLLG